MNDRTHNTGAAAWIVLVLAAICASGLAIVFLQTPDAQVDAQTDDETEVLPDLGRRNGSDDEPDQIESLPQLPSLPDKERQTATNTGRTSGWIEGRVRLDDALVGQIDVYHIIIEEAINDEATNAKVKKVRRFEQRFGLERDEKVGRFQLANIPFSDYGWRITAYAPKMNGSDDVVMLTSERAGANVDLTLRKPVAVHLVVKDQQRAAIKGVDVTLRPKGRPRQRPMYRGKSDVYGLVLHGRVMRGRYDLIIGPLSQPLIPIREIEVRLDKTPQFEQITLPQGGTLVVQVLKPSGYGIDKVKLSAVARDSKVFRKHEAVTDRTGKARFLHLPPGRYFIDATRKGFDRGHGRVTIQDKKENSVKIHLRHVF